MPSSLAALILISFVPVLTAAGGATFAAFRPPGPRLRSAIQHFAAGVVFSVVAVELLPNVTRVHDLFEIGWTFAAGLALMLDGLLVGIALLLVVGAVAGHTGLRGASEHTLAGVLSFGSAALLYLVTEELLVEAHETTDTTVATTMFFVGFLIFLLLGMLE